MRKILVELECREADLVAMLLSEEADCVDYRLKAMPNDAPREVLAYYRERAARARRVADRVRDAVYMGSLV